MKALRELERVEWRVLGAVAFADATTGTAIDAPLRVDAPNARFIRNRSGLYVLRDYPPLQSHEQQFLNPPALPALGSVSLTVRVSDPLGVYLPRLFTLALPRDANPANAGAANSLFRPQTVLLYPSANAPVGANWSVLRVSLTASPSGDALGGAGLRVFTNDKTWAKGMTDWRGEALLPVVGVPVTTFSEEIGAVVVSSINVSLRAAFDPAVGSRTPLADVRANRPPPSLPWVDPAALDANFDALPRSASLALTIAARRSQTVSLTLALP